MSRVIKSLYVFLKKICYYVYYIFLSEKEKYTTKRFREVISEKKFLGGDVMILALYEKGKLRSDTIELLKEAKNRNVYVIAINTLKINPDNYHNDLIDVYIEKDNLGRDFGSYQSGFSYLYEKKIFELCNRVLMINDSLFFSKLGLSKFISEMLDTEIDILGATENMQYSHHLGSFCISYSKSVINDIRFRKSWENYKLTNVRPLVIKRGEIALSKLLRTVARDPKNFKALYDVSYIENVISTNPMILNKISEFKIDGNKIWGGESVLDIFKNDKLLSSFYDRYIVKNKQTKKNGNNDLNYLDIVEFLSTENLDLIPNGHFLKEKLIGNFLTEYIVGSQIHTNCVLLHYLGLPIIKLDLFYRGVCDIKDISRIKSQLPIEQQAEFFEIITSRPYGGKYLTGHDKNAFGFGLI